jgi:hypothetical protein
MTLVLLAQLSVGLLLFAIGCWAGYRAGLEDGQVRVRARYYKTGKVS